MLSFVLEGGRLAVEMETAVFVVACFKNLLFLDGSRNISTNYKFQLMFEK